MPSQFFTLFDLPALPTERLSESHFVRFVEPHDAEQTLHPTSLLLEAPETKTTRGNLMHLSAMAGSSKGSCNEDSRVDASFVNWA